MAEVKSTLELVMERTRHMTLSEEDKREQALAEFKKSLGGLLQKVQDGVLGPEHFTNRPEGFAGEFAPDRQENHHRGTHLPSGFRWGQRLGVESSHGGFCPGQRRTGLRFPRIPASHRGCDSDPDERTQQRPSGATCYKWLGRRSPLGRRSGVGCTTSTPAGAPGSGPDAGNCQLKRHREDLESAANQM